MKFYKLIIPVGIALSLSGCYYQSVNQYDIQRAIKICKNVEDVAEIDAYSTGVETVTCMNGKYLSLSTANEQ